MQQRPRDGAPGIHHVNLGAAFPELFFRDEIDHLQWVRRFVHALERYGWTCIAFVQISTHWHAILEIADESLPVGMHWLNSEYAKDFNVRHERRGALVRSRYGSRRISDDGDLLGVLAYVANNPVEAGLAERAEDWRWSSFATTVGLRNDFPFVDATLVLSQLGTSPAAAMAALREFVHRRAGTKRLRK